MRHRVTRFTPLPRGHALPLQPTARQEAEASLPGPQRPASPLDGGEDAQDGEHGGKQSLAAFGARIESLAREAGDARLAGLLQVQCSGGCPGWRRRALLQSRGAVVRSPTGCCPSVLPSKTRKLSVHRTALG